MFSACCLEKWVLEEPEAAREIQSLGKEERKWFP